METGEQLRRLFVEIFEYCELDCFLELLGSENLDITIKAVESVEDAIRLGLLTIFDI